MTEPLDSAMLDQLVAARAPRDAFGPGSTRPLVAIKLDGANSVDADWLASLPCPVIGIGEGELADACDAVVESEEGLVTIARNVAAAPLAAMVLVQHLRASEGLATRHALIAESFAYASLQRGPEFSEWQGSQDAKHETHSSLESPLLVSRDRDCLSLKLNDPDNRNAIGVTMRDALCEALDLALDDGEIATVRLVGEGRCFSSGGEVGEFGSIADPATAHWIRSLRLPATRLAALGDRLEVHVDGAAIGAGAEIAAFGARVTASDCAWFQLPELKYGLIPGAGGTASVLRRIGRQRTALMALSMMRVTAQTALEWGLIDEVV